MVVDVEPSTGSETAWWRVAAVVGLVLIIATVIMPRDVTVSPERTYNDATVVVDGRTFDAVACESRQNGIEARYGTEGAAAYVRHMASGETIVVLHTDAEELISQSVTPLEGTTADQLAFAAEFDGGPPVTVAYDHRSMGWCR